MDCLDNTAPLFSGASLFLNVQICKCADVPKAALLDNLHICTFAHLHIIYRQDYLN